MAWISVLKKKRKGCVQSKTAALVSDSLLVMAFHV